MQTIDSLFGNKEPFNSDIEQLDNLKSNVLNLYGQENLTASDMILKLYSERAALYREMLKENENLINWLKKLVN